MSTNTNETTIEIPGYSELVAMMEAAKQRVKDEGAKACSALFKTFFSKNPEVTAVGWQQYTPYFNDGDACEFSVREFHVCTRTGLDFESIGGLSDEDDEGPIFRDRDGLGDDVGALKASIGWLARAADDDIFEASFGDHAMVIATPAGFHVNSYSHD